MVAEHRERLKQADGRPDHRFTSGELHWAGTALLCHLPRSVTGWEHAVETVALAPTLQRIQRCSIWRLSGRCCPHSGSLKGRSEQHVTVAATEVRFCQRRHLSLAETQNQNELETSKGNGNMS